MESISVEIFGRRYQMKTDSVEKTEQLQHYINSELSKIASRYGELDRDMILVLFSMMLSEEYLTISKELESVRSELSVLNTAGSLLDDNF
ncbi:MAG: cell division protein ZapA [Candidatus Zophobacter franzmannii]|nr:cell division protein ZapA [Candidatus Zophobacter franzmannii]